jgi:KUP system potassium uptake protein
MVGLATLATIIASQALISGVFSLTQQAIYMGYFPRLEIVHTSKDERGQIYIGVINYLLMAACVAVVLGFRSSEKLGGAYGLAVIGTMTITSITYFVVLRKVWKRPLIVAVPLVGAFLVIDLAFLAGNLPKILDGAWVPLVVAGLVFAVFWIWTEGQVRFRRALRSWSMPLDEFKRGMRHWGHGRQKGTGVFFTTHADSVPLVGKNLWLRDNVRPEHTLLITIVEEKVPHVPGAEMARIEEVAPGFRRLTASFGFMQHPDITRALKSLPPDSLKIDWEHLVFYLPEPHLVVKGGWWDRRFQQIYRFLSNNSLSVAEYFRVPPRDVIHVGVRLEL